MNNKNKIEIMAPVGSYESLSAAIQSKADSIYFGVGKLNMRSRSSANFTIDDLKKIISICKTHNIKSYLALNTIVYNSEIDEINIIITEAKNHNIDAIIASDFSVITKAKEAGIPVHASTQCNISNFESAKFYATFCDVIVLARELTLEQIKDINDKIEQENIKGPSGELLKTELFVHGALCMAISGKCYLSTNIMNHSANRGACLQLCRRSYTVKDKDEGFEMEIDNQYILSPKDICTIGFLNKIIDSGVSILKIEGRGRPPEYVKTTCDCYNEALISISDKTFTDTKIDLWKDKLKSVFNRDFWDGYYAGKHTVETTTKYGSQATRKKSYVAKCTNYFSKLKVAEFKIEADSISIGDTVLIIGPTTGVIELTINEIRVEYKNVEKVNKGIFCSIPLPSQIRRSDKLYKLIT